MTGTLSLDGLEGAFVGLAPMGIEHVDGLLEAATGDRSTFAFAPVPWDRVSMTAYVERALAHRASGEQLPLVTYSRADGRIVGTTRFYDLRPWDWSWLFPGSSTRQRSTPDVASIGYTWLSPSVQRTPINTEAKLLMMTHAFEQWQVRAVRLQTDARNERSRAAIIRLGCSLDGVIRADRPGADGAVRDSAVFSMLAAEWPAHRERLRARLAG
jgi:RimJ/RimL family protein N-acetyltransferase